MFNFFEFCRGFPFYPFRIYFGIFFALTTGKIFNTFIIIYISVAQLFVMLTSNEICDLIVFAYNIEEFEKVHGFLSCSGNSIITASLLLIISFSSRIIHYVRNNYVLAFYPVKTFKVSGTILYKNILKNG